MNRCRCLALCLLLTLAFLGHDLVMSADVHADGAAHALSHGGSGTHGAATSVAASASPHARIEMNSGDDATCYGGRTATIVPRSTPPLTAETAAINAIARVDHERPCLARTIPPTHPPGVRRAFLQVYRN